MSDREQDFYRHLRRRVKAWSHTRSGQGHRWVELVLLAPDLFHLLCKLARDPRVPPGQKAKLAGAIAYFLSPLDLLPELLLGPVGLLDDIAVAAFVLHQVVNHTDVEIVRDHWAGDGDLLEVIQRILAAADQMVGSGRWRKLLQRFGHA
jgi:uncharacterized membrane protein YkvA (DUF1232 family)